MSERRRVQRQPCDLPARIFVPGSSKPIKCNITDISTRGSFVRTNAHDFIPPTFDLAIGLSNLPRACRIARYEADGLGVEFLDPVRREVEEILVEYAFKEELVFEALSPSLTGDATMTRVRLHQTVDALMALIERRHAMSWQHADAA
ncbi:PilZ domain-containing protein [Methylobacterium iners]|uniref:PilZ domain-containing protein n=1 Tax=Methylobacterium iners TaxID=418707 RepID=A0ABQ4S523_9HYPH|nr:PilZ domain-containing protein [Methylobacterium iners]GJD98026.1 hypothetical protein OCOJLMKI_5265 [Methylobacterium iners]